MIYILNSRYLQRILVACDRNSKEWRFPKMSKDVERCPAELVVRVSSAPDCPTSPTINTSSVQHQHKYTHPHHHRHYQRHHNHHHVYHRHRTHQKRCHENFAKLRVAGISNFVHISDTSTEYILTVNV